MSLKHLMAAALAATAFSLFAASAGAQEKIELKFTTASVPTDAHTQSLQVFKEKLEAFAPNRFDVQIYDSSTLFAQNAELDALQRGNAEMAYISFQSIADVLPEYGILTAGYLFQSPEHYRAFMKSSIGGEFRQKVSDEMGIQLLDVCYLGTRQLNLREKRDVSTPADLAGVKLRMPGADAWLFLGEALGASPTPLPFGEVYLALQTGTIDGQDNPLPSVEAARFYEVTQQISLTGHLVDGLPVALGNAVWDKLDDKGKAAITEAAVASCDANNAKRMSDEARLVEFFKEKGLTVTTPDVAAFRAHVQDHYLKSDRAAAWPEGWLDQINALAK